MGGLINWGGGFPRYQACHVSNNIMHCSQVKYLLRNIKQFLTEKNNQHMNALAWCLFENTKGRKLSLDVLTSLKRAQGSDDLLLFLYYCCGFP